MCPARTGSEAPEPRRLYWQGPNFKSKAVRVGDWKLVSILKGKEWKEELFDLARDPNEAKELADAEPTKLKELQNALAEFEAGDRDAVATADR